MNIRATTLEKFWTCKHRYKFEPPFSWSPIFFKFGSDLHKYVELALTDQLNEEIQDLILQQRPVKQRMMIIQMAEKILAHAKEQELTYIVSELWMSKEFSELDITLEGTMDLLFKTKDWEYIVVDIKTAKSKWQDDHANEVKQKIIYPVLFEFIYEKHIARFEYWIVTKTNNPELQVVSIPTEDSYPQDVIDILTELKETEESQARVPNYPNYSCWYCPLKWKCQDYKVL